MVGFEDEDTVVSAQLAILLAVDAEFDAGLTVAD
jgi:hypothetical protein